MRSLALITLLVLLQGCTTTDNPVFCDDAQPCDNGLYCDVGGDFGPANRCVEVGGSCTPGPVNECADDLDNPICDETQSFCRRCLATDICPSGVCNVETGRCEAATCTAGENNCAANEPVCDEATGTCQSCEDGAAGDGICTAGHPSTPYCVGGGCVQCRDTLDCTDGLACNENNVCDACTDHAQCPSGVCDIGGGTCVVDTEIIYVDAGDPNAENTGDCTQAVPCLDLVRPMELISNGDTREIMVILGGEGTMYQGSYTIQSPLALFGDGAILANDTPDTPVFTVTGDTTNVSMENLVITGSTGNATGHGIACASGASLRLSQMEVKGNGAVGINSDACASLVVERSVIGNNARGGISLTNTGFEIRNNFIVRNGDFETSFVGGVLISITQPVTPQVFDFNTVATNQAMNTVASGVRCNVPIPITATGNIVYFGSSTIQVSGDCIYEFSNIQGMAGGNNIDAMPVFVNTDAMVLDYHLQDTSGGIDVMNWTPDGCPGPLCVDIDGQERGQGDGFDIGADEYRP